MDYHEDYSAISKTMLNVFADSPLEYWLTYINKSMPRKAPSRPMELGTIMHAILLEKKEPGDVCAVYPDDCFKSNGSLNPSPAAAFRDSQHPKICVKSETLDEVMRCFESVVYSPLYAAIKASYEFEQRHDATIDGIACKCKPDIVCDMGDHLLIYDLKFCLPQPSAFERSAKRFRYWLQDAHYSAVLSAETGKPVQFRFFALEPTYPYRVQSYWYGMRDREIARDEHRRLLGELRECQTTGIWKDNWTHELRLNFWEVGGTEELELVGFDDD